MWRFARAPLRSYCREYARWVLLHALSRMPLWPASVHDALYVSTVPSGAVGSACIGVLHWRGSGGLTAPLQHTEQTFRESFGKDISEYFETFEPKPIASGTVGQVLRSLRAPLRRVLEVPPRWASVGTPRSSPIAHSWY